ncbi:MAG: metal ABC transporter ATP-binding protein [Kiritimatiellia bacterium]
MANLRHANGAAVTFENVTVSLGGNTILENVSARIPRGSCTAIVGPNGAGKTTMLLALLGEVPFSGRIRISRADEGRRLRIGYVPQRLQFDRGMPLTVLEFMVMGWQRSPLWFGVRPAYLARARELLASVKMDGAEKRRIGALSGGELQRVLLALALGREPDLLVLDEPASGVDFQGEQVFCELLDKLRSEHGFTQLMVSHDLPTVTHHANHVICLNRKVAAEGSPRDVLTAETLTAIFGVHMGLVDSRALPNAECTCSSSCGRGVARDA